LIFELPCVLARWRLLLTTFDQSCASASMARPKAGSRSEILMKPGSAVKNVGAVHGGDIDALVAHLSKLTIQPKPASTEGVDVLRHLRDHLERTRQSISAANSSEARLRVIAHNHAKGLLKIAQHGLRNTTGGTELLSLVCNALHILLSLSSHVGVSDLTMEKLWYQALARSIDLGEYRLGLMAAACLQRCL
ncbi:unnamed protein product, partial [Discosporangium mesarthrocarpum]